MIQQRIKMTDKERKENQPYDIDVIPELSHPTKTTRVVNKLVAGALVLIMVFVGIFLYWTLEDTDILVVNNAPFPARTLQENIENPGIVLLNVDYCKSKDITGRLRMSFVSQYQEILLPIVEESGPVACTRRDLPVLLPKNIPSGTYHIHFNVRYDVNPLKRGIVNDFDSQDFEVSNGNVR